MAAKNTIKLLFKIGRHGNVSKIMAKTIKRHDMIQSQYLPIKTTSQSAFTCLKLTIETIERGVKYVQS